MKNSDRRYNAIQQNIWHRDWFHAFSGDEQRVYLYLLNHPNQTMLGCFVLQIGALTDDLQLSKRTAERIIRSFIQQSLISFCEHSRLCYVHEHYTCNAISSGNAALSAKKVLSDLPRSPIWLTVAGDILRQPLTQAQKGAERDKYEELVLALQHHAGAWLPGRKPLVLSLNDIDNGGSPMGRAMGTPTPSPSGALGVGVGVPLGDSAPAPVLIITPSSTTVVDTATETPAERAASPTTERWQLLQQLTAEVARYNVHPLVSDTYPAATLDAAEANLRDLQAAGVDAVAEVTMRLRRTSNLAKLKQTSCPAVIAGRMAEYALRDIPSAVDSKNTGGEYGHLEQSL